MQRVRDGLRLTFITAILTILAGSNHGAIADDDMSVPQGLYLGQKAPGKTPELFAPGSVSRSEYFEHSGAIFSPDLREVCWSAKPNAERYYNIYYMEMIGDSWTTPSAVPFLEHNYGERGPVISPDGHRLYFDHAGDIWMVERQSDGWSTPAVVSELSDSSTRDRICSVTQDGSVYFIRSGSAPGVRELFVCRTIDGALSAPVKSDKAIPTGYKAVGDMFVAPDESYMITELHIDDRTSELFVSYKLNDGSWSDEIKLPLGWGRCPTVSPDGKYIFFMRREGIYWADAGILEELKPIEAK